MQRIALDTERGCPVNTMMSLSVRYKNCPPKSVKLEIGRVGVGVLDNGKRSDSHNTEEEEHALVALPISKYALSKCEAPHGSQ